MPFDLGKAIQSQQYARPQKDYLWRIQLPSMETPAEARSWMGRTGLGSVSPFAASAGEESFDIERLSYRITNAQVPFFEITTDNQSFGNSFWYYALKNDIGSVTIEIEEHEDGQTLRYLDEWKSKIINSNGTYNPPVYYKRPIKFFKLANVQLDLAVHEYQGYFISQISELSNSYDSNDIMRYSVTFTGDSVRYKYISGSDLDINQREREILQHDLEQGSIIDRFSGLDAGDARSIFDRVVRSATDAIF